MAKQRAPRDRAVRARRAATAGRTIGLVALLCVAATGAADANMVLSDVIVDLQAPGEMRHDVDVRNDGDDVLYIEVNVQRVPDPAVDASGRSPETDPRTAGLLASPRRLAIAPGERKRVRLVARRVPTEDDLVYRVAFVPRENEAQTEEAMAFKVLIGYEVLVLVRPPGAKPALDVQRDGTTLRVENRGRSSLLVRKLEYCPGDGAPCDELPGNRLYAGEVWNVELPGTGELRMHQTYRTENTVAVY